MTTVSGPSIRHLERCRYCGAEEFAPVISLGLQPPSNSFLRPEQTVLERKFPLDVVRCAACQLVQLHDTVPPEATFDEYLYLSSSSQALVEHYAKLAGTLVASETATANDVVVDIGCNDGILLASYPPELCRIGVEPSRVAAIAEARGFTILREFFSVETAARIVERQGRALIATATNVFAHVDDPGGFLEGIRALLRTDGIFVIEVPYLVDMVDQLLFDVIYHEHLAYLGVTPLVPLMSAHGLVVVDAERVPFGASGPAIRVSIRPRDSHRRGSSRVERILAEERAWGIDRATTYTAFSRRVSAIQLRIRALFDQVRAEGTVAGYGAPAKGNTLLNSLGFTVADIPFIADATAAKQGLLTPGSHIPIVSDAELLARRPPIALLLAWNYVDHFLAKSEYVRRGGRFLVPLPEPALRP